MAVKASCHPYNTWFLKSDSLISQPQNEVYAI